MDKLSIRACRAEDLPAITRIYGHYVRSCVSTFEEEPPGPEEMTARHGAILDQGYPYLVAHDGASLVGYSYASAYRPRPAYRYTVENSVYIAPERRGRGAGRKLLDELIRQCADREFRQMIAVIANRSPASVALHAAAGFREIGQLEDVGRKFDRWIGTTLMQKALSPPPGHDLERRRYRLDALNVSHCWMSPDSKPCLNHLTRCSDEPWVKASGTT